MVNKCIRIDSGGSTKSNQGEGENAGAEPVRADAEDRGRVKSGERLGLNTEQSRYRAGPVRSGTGTVLGN